MKIRHAYWLFLLSLPSILSAALVISWPSAPTSVNNNTDYTVTARATSSNQWPELFLYKSGSLVGTSSAQSAINVSTTQSDNGGQSITYFAEAFDALDHHTTSSISVTIVQATTPTTFSFSNLSQAYDGGTKTASVTPTPGGATYSSDLTKGPAVGSYTVSATATGSYIGSGSATLVITKGNQATVSLGAATSQAYGTSQTLTLSGGSGTGSLSCAIVNQSSAGVATLSGTTLTANVSSGWVDLQATRAEDSNYNAGTSSVVRVSFTTATATFSFSNLSQTYDGSSKTATVTPTPAGATYTSDLTKGPGVGTYTVSATATGNYAGSGSDTLTIGKAAQSITFTNPGTKAYGAPLTLSATASSGLTISYSVTSGPASVSGNTVTFTGTGSVTIKAAQAGNSNFNAASDVSQTFSVTAATTTFALSAVSFAYNGSAQGPTVVPSPAGATFTSGGTLSATAVGTYTATATATGNYTGSNSSLSWSIASGTQTITFTAPGSQFVSVPLTLAATSSSGLSVSYSVTAGPATVTGNVVTFTGTGSVTVQASQAGNSNYAPATPVSRTFAVAKATPTAPSFTNRTLLQPAGASYAVKTADLNAVFIGPAGSTVNPTGTITYTLVGPGTTVIAGSALTVDTSYTVQAAYPGDANYNAATASATWLVAGRATDSNHDGVPDVIEQQLGLNPSNARQADTTNQTQVKVHKPN
jgi:hypothetical protein